ncbi:MAG: hypothetical protein ICV60_16240 [Pyrinomonadaceae bacterium]|nr:hypothetical protein [Pyrinomonadaceae bacterium]
MLFKMFTGRTSVLLILVLVAFSCVTGATGRGQTNGGLPEGNWTIKLSHYAGPEYESMPLQVTSVKGRVQDAGIWITERYLLNRSDQAVIRAYFDLFFYNEKEPDVLLFRRPISPLSFKNRPLLPGDTFPTLTDIKAEPPRLGSFALPLVKDLFAPLIKDGKLEGDYRIAIGVTKVLFEDGSVWELKTNMKQTGVRAFLQPSS